MSAVHAAYAPERPGAQDLFARAPRLSLFLTEPARGALQLGVLPYAWPWLAHAPRSTREQGSGQGVLVLPGLGGSDTSTAVLRRYLHDLGYAAWGWRLGRNVGPTAEVLDTLPRTITLLAERTGGPVSLVGWSLGGIYARELARDASSAHIRQVITLGSPFALTADRQSRANGAFRAQSVRHDPRAATREQVARPIAAASTAIYSRRDGIVHWRSCIEPATDHHENVEVRCAHLGFGVDPATMWVIADRLAQPSGEWRPFRPPALLRGFFPTAAG